MELISKALENQHPSHVLLTVIVLAGWFHLSNSSCDLTIFLSEPDRACGVLFSWLKYLRLFCCTDPSTLRSLQTVIGKILSFREEEPTQQRVTRPPRPHHPPHPPPSLEQIEEESPLVEDQVQVGHSSPGPGQQELYPGSEVYLPTVRLAAMHQESRQDCMRLFHQLFEHFFSEDDLVGAVAFGKRGKVPNGKKVLDRRIVDGIISEYN